MCLLFVIFIESDLFTSIPKILKFAKYLEEQKDYKNAICEYLRAIYLTEDKNLKDSLHYVVFELYLKTRQFQKALNELKRINKKDEKYRLKLGKLYFFEGQWDSALKYWKDEKLMGLIYLYAGRYREARKFLSFRGKPSHRFPLCALFLSALLPGAGRVYAGRIWDGVASLGMLCIFSSFAYLGYKTKDNFKLYFFGALSFSLYLGELYGAYTSAKYYNWKSKREFCRKVKKQNAIKLP